jgi:hypothetical protein
LPVVSVDVAEGQAADGAHRPSALCTPAVRTARPVLI